MAALAEVETVVSIIASLSRRSAMMEVVGDLEAKDRCERWFVRRGLPHLIDDYSATDDIFTEWRRSSRWWCSPSSSWRLVTGGPGWRRRWLSSVGSQHWPSSSPVPTCLVAGDRFQLPEDIGPWELVLYVVLPTIPTAIGSQGSVLDNIIMIVVFNLVLLAIGYVVTAWALLPMMRWSIGQARRQVGDVANLAMKSLPTLLIFSAFIFINAEMWQVVNDFTLPLFGLVALLVVGLGGAFVFVSVRRLTVDLARFRDWGDVRPRCDATPVESLVPWMMNPLRTLHPCPAGRVERQPVALRCPGHPDPVGVARDQSLLCRLRPADRP